MLKKIIAGFMIIILIVSMVACAKKPLADVVIKAPDGIDKDIPVTELDSGEKLYGGFIYKEHHGEGVYIPYVDNKHDGVVYLDDTRMYNPNYDNMKKVYTEINMPQGCEALPIKGKRCWSFNLSAIEPPEFATPDGYKQGEEYLKFKDMYIHRDYLTFHGTDEQTYSSTTSVRDVDVQAVSIVLYEDFYKKSQDIDIKIYAVDKKLMKEKLGETYKAEDINKKLMTSVIDAGYKGVELVASKTINVSGVYYIDWKEIGTNPDYVVYIVSLDFGTDDYSYILDGEFMYNVLEDKHYSEWKADNKDRFIE